MNAHEHRMKRVDKVAIAVLTISDSRTQETDTSGRLICDLLAEQGHQVGAYHIIPDDPDAIGQTLLQWRDDPDYQAVLTTGGTGLAERDTTYEVVTALLDKRLDGFGEVFRMVSYKEIGASGILSRAIAGTMGDTVVFCMPGSTNAVRLAMRELILPVLGHVVYLLAR